MKKSIGLFAVLATMLTVLAVLPAMAAVTFDPSTGTGFVGKGDVQLAFGWNNPQIQSILTGNPQAITFKYVSTDTYEVVRAWATGNPDNPVSLNNHIQTITTTVMVNAQINGDPRKTNGQNQFTGFNLLGKGTSTVDGTLPVVSPTVTYVTFTWTTQEWDGTWETVPNPNYNGKNSPTIQVKHYVTVTHETDQLPAYYDDDGNLVLYMEGNNKAVLSVTLLDSAGKLYAVYNGVEKPLNWPPIV